jgi:hypothetical protein
MPDLKPILTAFADFVGEPETLAAHDDCPEFCGVCYVTCGICGSLYPKGKDRTHAAWECL